MRRRLGALAVAAGVLATACSPNGHRPAAPPATTRASAPTAIDRSTLLRAAPPVGFLSAPVGAHPHTLTIWGWNGVEMRTIRLGVETGCCGGEAVSPDGTRILLGSTVYDDIGRAIGTDVAGTWADDSRHLCAFRPQASSRALLIGGPAELYLVEPGRPPRRVAQVEGYNPHGGPVVLRCSIRDDSAVVGTTFTASIVAVDTVRLSSGRVGTPRWWNRRPGGIIAISGNGRYLLEEGPSTPLSISSNVVDAATGKVVGNVEGQPQSISWNGHLVVTGLSSLDVAVTDWRSGTVLWRSANRPPRSLGFATSAAVSARPLSDDLAIDVSAIPGRPLQAGELWLIAPGHRPRRLAAAVAPGVI